MSNASSLSGSALLSALENNSARRGQTVLKLIQAKARESANRSDVRPSLLGTESELRDTRNLAYMSAIATGAQSAPKPTIYEIERFSGDWADIVPHSPEIRADIAWRLAKEYRFEHRFVSGIIAALSLNDPAVHEAFEKSFQAKISSIYVASTRAGERAKWAGSAFAGWFDNLPAFWASFAITISSTLGPSVLYFPILLAGFGAHWAAAIVLAIGGLNVLTLSYLAEAQLRSLPRLRQFGFDRMIAHYLGTVASVVLKASLFIYCVMVLFVYTGGFMEAIRDALGFGAFVSFVPLFAFILWSLSPRKSSGTLTLSLLIALINFGVLISFAALLAIEILRASPLSGDIEAGVPNVPWPIAIGAVMYSFAGQISVSNSARLVLRDVNTHTGFFRGAIAGLASITLIYSIWTWIVVRAVSTGTLESTGSVLALVSDSYGLLGIAVGLTFVALSLGIGASYYALAAYHGLSNWLQYSAAARHRNLSKAIGLLVIAATMVSALFVFWSGAFELSRYFGLVGGLMAPIVAGIFPVLILIACRKKGLAPQHRVATWLSYRLVAGAVLVLFAFVYPLQTLSPEYEVWYRFASAAVLLIVVSLIASLFARHVFKPGAVVVATKGKDGWVPGNWKLYVSGVAVTEPRFSWKTRTKGDFDLVDETTHPSRTLIAFRFAVNDTSGQSVDIDLKDETADSELTFDILQAEGQVLEVVLK